MIANVLKGIEGMREKLQRARRAELHESRQNRRPFFMAPAEEQDRVHHMYRNDFLKSRLALNLFGFLHSKPVQVLLTWLLLVDVLVVVVELVFDGEFTSCKYTTRDAISCCSATNTSGSDSRSHSDSGPGSGSGSGVYGRMLEALFPFIQDNFGGVLSGRRLSGHALCEAPWIDSPMFPATCDEHKYAEVHLLHEILFWISISILFIFQVELLLLLCIDRLHFLRNKLYLVDFVVVASALLIELISRYSYQMKNADLAGVLVFARCWRFVRRRTRTEWSPLWLCARSGTTLESGRSGGGPRAARKATSSRFSPGWKSYNYARLAPWHSSHIR